MKCNQLFQCQFEWADLNRRVKSEHCAEHLSGPQFFSFFFKQCNGRLTIGNLGSLDVREGGRHWGIVARNQIALVPAATKERSGRGRKKVETFRFLAFSFFLSLGPSISFNDMLIRLAACPCRSARNGFWDRNCATCGLRATSSAAPLPSFIWWPSPSTGKSSTFSMANEWIVQVWCLRGRWSTIDVSEGNKLTEWPIGSRFEWICLNRSSSPGPRHSGKNRANWQPLGAEKRRKMIGAQKRLRGSYYNKNNLPSLYSFRSTCVDRMEKRLNSSLSLFLLLAS